MLTDQVKLSHLDAVITLFSVSLLPPQDTTNKILINKLNVITIERKVAIIFIITMCIKDSLIYSEYPAARDVSPLLLYKKTTKS